MEPCFNPALEAQAIGRVHRLGQKRRVEIIRLLVKDSVDSRIGVMLEKKYGKMDGSEANDKTDAEKDGNKDTGSTSKSHDDDSDAESNKDTDSVSKSDADVGATDDGGGCNEDTSDGDKKPEAVDMLDAADEVAVQKVLVGSIYRDKATIVAEELDLLYGVENYRAGSRSNDRSMRAQMARCLGTQQCPGD
jgi:superfamily II DNA or RNA helicase